MKRLVPFLCASMIAHAFAFAALALVTRPETGMAGSPDGDPDRVFVVVASEKDYTPVAPTPGAMDSPESTDSRREQTQVEPEPEDRPELLARETPDGAVLTSDTKLEEIPEIPPEITERQKIELKDQEQSQASNPQIASNPLMRRTALGRELHDFESKLLAAIRQSTFFPQEALEQKRYGQVIVAFTINRDGTLSAVYVVNSSGVEALNDAAQEIVRRAAKAFPAFPRSVPDETLAYTVPIYFKERGSTGSPRSTPAP